MQQIVFKKGFFVLFYAVKVKTMQYLEEKKQPIKIIVFQKNPEKHS